MKLSRIHDEPDPVAVVRAWCNAAGPAVARAVFPGGYQGGRLEVIVPDRAWLREMEACREELMRRLRREKRMDQLREICLVLDPVPVRPKEISPALSGEFDSHPISPEILQAARAIGDEDLSRRWTAAVSRLLGATRPNRPGR